MDLWGGLWLADYVGAFLAGGRAAASIACLPRPAMSPTG
jgi:hypothetical protein